MAEAIGVCFNRDYYFDPVKRHEIDCKCNEYAEKQFAGMRLFYSESNLGRLDYWDNSQVLIGGIQPNMILGMLLGADFVPQDDKDADITPRCRAGRNFSELPKPENLLEHDLMKLFDEQIRGIRDDSENRLRPIPPFFWDSSGRATIHGVLTTAQKFLGETVFMDMITEPQAALEIMQWIARAYIVLCRHFSEIAELPITEIHVGECSSCMVAPELIERFVAPSTCEIGRQLGPIRLHSCGPSTNHLQAFAKIENLQSLDLGGDSSVAKARELFGKEMPISIAPLPQDMSAESSEGILNWARRILEENDNGSLEFLYHLEPGYNVDNTRALTEFVS
ncbi:MAG: hypothetical protein ACYS8Z_02370 [Planctomycetota bacterium]|jgi:hypothetical protein